MRAQAGTAANLRTLVSCLVVPYCEMLTTAEGRAYVRIVAQLRGTFAAWRVQSDAATTKHMSSILNEIEGWGRGPEAVRRERAVALIMLITSTTAERARLIDDGHMPELDAEEFVANLVTMCSAVQTAQ